MESSEKTAWLGGDAKALKLFKQRNKLLTAIREHSMCDPGEQNHAFIFQYCCNILKEAFPCNSVWAGDIDREQCSLIHLASSPAVSLNTSMQNYVSSLLINQFHCTLSSFDKPVGQYRQLHPFKMYNLMFF